MIKMVYYNLLEKLNIQDNLKIIKDQVMESKMIIIKKQDMQELFIKIKKMGMDN